MITGLVMGAQDGGAENAGVKSGTLRVFGDWFGRPMDNCHIVVGAEADGDHLIVRFDQGERLTVWSPDGAVITSDTFRIARASRVRWEWYYYGRPPAPENLCTEEHWVDDATVHASRTAAWATPNFSPSLNENAVELLWTTPLAAGPGAA